MEHDGALSDIQLGGDFLLPKFSRSESNTSCSMGLRLAIASVFSGGSGKRGWSRQSQKAPSVNPRNHH